MSSDRADKSDISVVMDTNWRGRYRERKAEEIY